MPQIFRPYADSAARATLVTLLLGPFAIAGLAGRAALLRLTGAAAPALGRIPVVLTFADYLRGTLTETVPLRGQNAGLRGDRNAAPTRFPQPRGRDPSIF